MARRSKQNNSGSGNAGFRFEWVSWTPKQLTELRGWLDGNADTLEKSLIRLADEGWKLSISENQRSGRYLASITDKWDRKGCAGVSWGVEHSSVSSAILGAVYYATEIIGEGLSEEQPASVDDLW